MAKGQRSVTLPADEVERFREAAEAAGMSLAAWLTAAGRERRRREAADGYAAYCAQPEIVGQLAGYLRAVRPVRRRAAGHD